MYQYKIFQINSSILHKHYKWIHFLFNFLLIACATVGQNILWGYYAKYVNTNKKKNNSVKKNFYSKKMQLLCFSVLIYTELLNSCKVLKASTLHWLWTPVSTVNDPSTGTIITKDDQNITTISPERLALFFFDPWPKTISFEPLLCISNMHWNIVMVIN